MSRTTPIAQTAPEGLELATLAGGCFWCLEPAFAELKGVLDVECGYAGAELKRAGFDAVVVRGKAAKPSYIWINNGAVEIHLDQSRTLASES